MKRILAWLMSVLLALVSLSINPNPAIAAPSGNGWADKVVEFHDSGTGPIPGPYGGPPRSNGIPRTGRYCMAPVKADVFIGAPPPPPVIGRNPNVKWLSLPSGSYVTVSFEDELITDGPGNDIFIQSFDLRDSANENADVYVSADGSNFTFLGRVNERGTVQLDLATIGFKQPVKYVKVVGVDEGGCSPGFDIINVRGLPGSVKPTTPTVKPTVDSNNCKPAKPAPSGNGWADKVVQFYDSGTGPIPGPYGGPPRSNGRPRTGRYCMAPVKADVFVGSPPPAPVISQNPNVKWLALPAGSYVTVSFEDEFITDGPGNDIFIQSFDRRDSANENADVYVSADGSNFTFLGRVNERGTVQLDLATIGFKQPVKYVKVVGVDQGGCSPGFDLINVRGLPGSVKTPVETNNCKPVTPPQPPVTPPQPPVTPPKPPVTPPKPPVTPADTGIIEGIKWLDTNGDGKRNSSLIQGDNPDVFFVVDISGSTVKGKFLGESSVGDVNNDGKPDTILDAEIAGFQALNQQLIDKGFGKTARISVIYFADGGAAADVKPATNGVQVGTTPASDGDSSGTPDVEEVLGTLQKRFGDVGVNTNFEAALQTVINTMSNLGTANGQGNVIFLSDGKSTHGGSFDDEVQELRQHGVNLSAFGVGTGSSLSDLKIIDPNAVIFTNLDELLAVFNNLQSPEEAKKNAELEPVQQNVTIYLDLNDNGNLDDKEPVSITNSSGSYRFKGIEAGTYTIREVIPEGYVPTTPPQGSTTVKLTPGAKLTVLFGNQATSTHTASIININAQVNNKENPVRQTLNAGTYRVTQIGLKDGGKYEAWNSSGIVRECDAQGENCNYGWESRYYFRSPYHKVSNGNCDRPKFASCRYDNASKALENATAPVVFTLNKDTQMLFYIEDSNPSNNGGGVSLKVEHVGSNS